MDRLLAMACLAATLLTAAGPAYALAPEPRVHGPYCPPAGCAGASSSAPATAAAFSAAALCAGLLARRRPPSPG